MNEARTFAPDERSDEALERHARRRAAVRMGWYIHAIVYVTVNAFLMLVAALHGRSWAMVPALGWGLGLAIHGFVVFLRLGGGGLHQRLLARERRRLMLQRDPW
jgi:hypothetical protein